jgi:hypothetical protein
MRTLNHDDICSVAGGLHMPYPPPASPPLVDPRLHDIREKLADAEMRKWLESQAWQMS